MSNRTAIQHISLWPSPRLFVTVLLSAAVLICWVMPRTVVYQNSALSKTGIDESEMDAVLQRAASEALDGREGTIIVLDPQTGRLRAIVNQRQAFEEAFSPGSTIKPFTALTALRLGLINEKSRLLCQEHYISEDFEITCAHPKISAPFDSVQALSYSCNYYFGKLGERLDAASFNATLASFGFGARTDADNEREATGNLPRGERWRASNALGESTALRVTPIQLLTAYAALFNGGHLYTPQTAASLDFNKKERASVSIAPSHRALLLEGMRGAVVYGTAERSGLSRLPLYLFGKTGTATASDSLRTHGWFIGFASGQGGKQGVSPERVELAVLVFLKQAHGAECAEASQTIFAAFAGERVARQATTRERDETPVSLASTSSTGASLSTWQVRVHLTREGRTVTLPFEDYVLGVLAAEGAIETEPEALKALAVAVRTYALRNLNRHSGDGYDFCDLTHCQRFTFIEAGENGHISDLLRRTFTETAGEVLVDEHGRTVDAYFHAACGGMTANVTSLWGSAAPAHLRGVRDDYCAAMPHHDWTDVIPAARLAEALRSDARTDMGARLENVIVSKRDATGRAELITLEGAHRRIVRGWDFKIIVGRALGWQLLKSSRFEVAHVGPNYIFRGGGFGHGVGLCQEGTHVMAGRGATYRQILKFYFPGTSVGRATNEPDLSALRRPANTERREDEAGNLKMRVSKNATTWKADVLAREAESQTPNSASLAASLAAPRPVSALSQNRRLNLSSEHFHLSSPASVERREAEGLLRALEATRADLLRRVSAAAFNFTEPQAIDVTVHATTGDFVAATGQPWWAAAATRGRRIELQPLLVLRRRRVLLTTLRHEYAHSVIDALSQNRAPRWLAEGLAIYVAGEGALLKRFAPQSKLTIEELEEKLAQPASAEEMRALYATAYARVLALVREGGEQSVWRRVAGREK